MTVPNRLVFAPLGLHGFVGRDGSLSRRGVDYYVARASGGVGLIVSGSARVGPQLERDPRIRRLRADGISNDGAWIRKLADAVHRHGTKIAIQVSCGVGRVGIPSHLSGRGGIETTQTALVGPSAIPNFWDPSVMHRPLTAAEIRQILEDFRRSAEVIKSAGADAININGHSGYLTDQFMTALWNKRTDEYGGTFGRRMRFPLGIIAAVKKGAGANFPVIFRFSLTHFMPGGRDIDEGLEIARLLEKSGVDALDVDAGCYESHQWVHPSTYSPPGPLVHIAQMAKKAVKIPVMVVGKLQYPELAERVLAKGKADFIMLGKQLLADPEWPNKVREGRFRDIRPCLGDLECLRSSRKGERNSCTVNPASGSERTCVIRRARRKKSILVIGGGPGGMEAALVAALRGHTVTLWDKHSALGGNLVPASVPDFKLGYRDLIAFYATQLSELGVTIELSKEATPESVRTKEPDVVFVATGSNPVIPDILGADRGNVVTATDLLLGKAKVSEAIVVIGAGLVGSETALYLARQGKRVTLVARHELCHDMFWAPRMHLMKLLDEAGVRTVTQSVVQEITNEGVAITDRQGAGTFLSAGTVVLAVGLTPDAGLLNAVRSVNVEVRAIGDCVEPRDVKAAIREAFEAARLV